MTGPSSPNHIHEYDDAVNNGSNHELISYKTNSYTYKDERLTHVGSGADGYDSHTMRSGVV